MIRKLIVVVMICGLAACVSAPSPNPQFVDRINTAFNQASAKHFKAAGRFKQPMPYKVGQYIVTGITGPSERMVTRMAIVGKEQGGWIIENHVLSATAESVTQMLVTGMESVYRTGTIDQIDILWVKVKPQGQSVQTFQGPMLELTKGLYRKALAGLEMQASTFADGGSVSVPAGRFEGTVKTSTEVSVMGRRVNSEAWLHPAVPINGMVKSVSSSEHTITELLAFGLSGAKRSF